MSQVEDRAIGFAAADLVTTEHTQLSDVRFKRGVQCALYGCSAFARTVAFIPRQEGWSFLCRNHAMDLYSLHSLWPGGAGVNENTEPQGGDGDGVVEQAQAVAALKELRDAAEAIAQLVAAYLQALCDAGVSPAEARFMALELQHQIWEQAQNK